MKNPLRKAVVPVKEFFPGKLQGDFPFFLRYLRTRLFSFFLTTFSYSMASQNSSLQWILLIFLKLDKIAKNFPYPVNSN